MARFAVVGRLSLSFASCTLPVSAAQVNAPIGTGTAGRSGEGFVS
jgi:hypothetical protein